jgi:hypothetical protein
MLKHGEVNPLNVHELRRIEHCAPHFEKVFFDSNSWDSNILNWIYENLEGRFFLGEHHIAEDSYMISRKCAAFERHSEASYFTLMLDTFNQSGF